MQLLPPHLHDEIESTSYFTSRQQTHERPASASLDLASNHRLMSERAYGSPSKLPMAESPREYSIPAHPRDPRLPHTTGSTPPYASRGPSPILPPIRDLQSLPDRSLNPTNAAFPRPDPYAGHDLRAAAPVGSSHAYPPANYPGPAGPMMHYPAYATMAYQSDSEQTSPQGLSHAGPPSNFGIIGDPVDSRNKRRRGNLPKPITDILRAWFHEHLDHPYPSEEDKQMFMTRTGLSISQVSLFAWCGLASRGRLRCIRLTDPFSRSATGSSTQGGDNSPL